MVTLYRVTFEPRPDEAPPHIRLRRLLKLAGRGFKLRCVEVIKLPDGEPREGGESPERGTEGALWR